MNKLKSIKMAVLAGILSFSAIAPVFAIDCNAVLTLTPAVYFRVSEDTSGDFKPNQGTYYSATDTAGKELKIGSKNVKVELNFNTAKNYVRKGVAKCNPKVRTHNGLYKFVGHKPQTSSNEINVRVGDAFSKAYSLSGKNLIETDHFSIDGVVYTIKIKIKKLDNQDWVLEKKSPTLDDIINNRKDKSAASVYLVEVESIKLGDAEAKKKAEEAKKKKADEDKPKLNLLLIQLAKIELEREAIKNTKDSNVVKNSLEKIRIALNSMKKIAQNVSDHKAAEKLVDQANKIFDEAKKALNDLEKEEAASGSKGAGLQGTKKEEPEASSEEKIREAFKKDPAQYL